MTEREDAGVGEQGEEEAARFELLEPLLMDEDRSLWKRATETAAAIFDCPAAAVVVGASRGLHEILGQVGLGVELTAAGAIAAEVSPARAVGLGRGVALDGRSARLRGLGVWLQASQSLAAAPLTVGGGVVGALVLGLPGPAPRGWHSEGLARLAQDFSALLAHGCEVRGLERSSGVTAIDPGATRMALRGSMRRMRQTALQLAVTNAKLRRGLERLSEEELELSSVEAALLQREALVCYEHLRKRFEAAMGVGPLPEGRWARGQVLEVARVLIEQRPLVALGQELGAGRLSPSQAATALRMLGPRPPREQAMVEAIEALLGWLEATPLSVRCSA